jgi:hypothetical protein
VISLLLFNRRIFKSKPAAPHTEEPTAIAPEDTIQPNS